MASTPDEANAKIDPDNTYLWRMNSRRMEAEAVRDNLLYVSGDLDLTRSGPDIDHLQGLKSKRRSIYLRQAAEKEVAPAELDRAMHSDMSDQIVALLQGMGYSEVTIDPRGYRMGSLNEGLRLHPA